MNQKWLIIEKTIGVILIGWGGVLIYFLFNLVSLVVAITGENLNMFFVLNYHLLFLCPFLLVFGGVYLLFNKKVGWMAVLIGLLAGSIQIPIPAEKGKNIFTGTDISMTLSLLGLSIVYLILFYLLVQKPFRLKYRATMKTWRTVAFVVILIILDQTILYIIS